ncbi:MAG: FAD-dependent oxidoreductase [Actinomycetota bacterium]
MRERLVVVGGDAAGMSAASQARRLNPELEIVAFERSNYVSYSACGEPYFVGGMVDSLDDLVARTPDQFAARGIEVHTGHEVKEIDTDRREVLVTTPATGGSRRVAFDHLMVSTGSRPLRPSDISGIDLPGVVGLRTLEDADAMKRMLDESVDRVAILGGGYIGIEVAEVLVDLGKEVVMVTSGSHVLERTLDESIGELANRAVVAYGVELHTGLRIECIQGAERATGIGCEGQEFPADLVVIGLGVGPEVEVAQQAGIPLGATGAIAVDDHQRTGIDGVWSAGDCAETIQRVSGSPVNVALGTVANKTGRIAGTNIGGGDATFPGVLGTAITKIGEIEIARTGLKVAEARSAGFDPMIGLAKGTNTAAYWPSARRVDIMITADRLSGRLLGGQIIGGPGAGKKIDVIATAIWLEMTAAELAWLDLAYAPPFSGVWDLIHVAARRAAG